MSDPVGTVAWVDLGFHHTATTEKFYSGLFGWTFEDLGEKYGNYRLVHRHDHDGSAPSVGGAVAGGAMNVSAMTCPQGEPIPAAWGVFLSVDDLDARLALAQQHGATIAFPAMDIADTGRMVGIIDPTGAYVNLWQSDDQGFSYGETNGVVWAELMTHRFDEAAAFYSEVFGVTLTSISETMDDPNFRYVNSSTGWGIGDGTGVMDEDATGWRIYFGVESSDSALAKVVELGGSVLDGPVDSPFGRIATIGDPEGATFQLSAPTEAVPEG